MFCAFSQGFHQPSSLLGDGYTLLCHRRYDHGNRGAKFSGSLDLQAGSFNRRVPLFR
jgi:hypothetical protein